jgi:UDP-glucose 4-epimerase
VSARRALVTGAGGFVGANLVRRLLADGHEVTATTRPGASPWRLDSVADHLDVRELDLRDNDATAAEVSRARPEWVFNLAAHGAYSWQADPGPILAVSAVAAVALAEACRHADCAAFVQAGSSSEYGFKDHAPREDEPLEPNSAYAVAKATASLYFEYVAAAERLNAVVVRLYSVYGPFEDPRRLVATLVARGLKDELPPLVEPTVARDFVAAEDVVEAFVLAAERAGDHPGRTWNVGSGTQTTIAELVEVARDTLGIGAEPRWGTTPERSWDTGTWVSDPRRAERELGWTARTGLAQGLNETAEWMQSTPEARAAYGLDD